MPSHVISNRASSKYPFVSLFPSSLRAEACTDSLSWRLFIHFLDSHKHLTWPQKAWRSPSLPCLAQLHSFSKFQRPVASLPVPCAESLLFVRKSKIVLRSRSASQAGIHEHLQPPVHLINSCRGIPLSRPLSLSSYLGYQCTMDVSFPDVSSSKSISVWAK